MLIRCNDCGRFYDDEDHWTICPHNRLEAGYDTPRYNCGKPGYCAGHDLFNCTFEPPKIEPTPEGFLRKIFMTILALIVFVALLALVGWLSQ
jgi:hypothetical protein